MQLFRTTPNINFFRFRKIAAIFSIAMIILGVGSLFLKGIRLGIDFKGGINVLVQFSEEVKINEVRELLENEIAGVSVTSFGAAGNNEFLLAIAEDEQFSAREHINDSIKKALSTQYPKMEIRKVEFVGPKVGSQLRNQAIYAILLSLLGILIYISFRFEFWFGVGAVIALFHDIFIIVTIFILLGKEFNLIIVAALLTILGYSLNDTIVIFDRIREKKKIADRTAGELVNLSVNECLSRTILTSLTTLLVVLMLYIFGGEILRDFSLSIVIGVLVGTYSSVFVAGSSAVFLEEFFQKKPVK